MLKRALAIPAVLLPLLAAAACGSNTTASDPAGSTTSTTTTAPASPGTTTAAGGTTCSYLPDGSSTKASAPPSTPTESGKVSAVIHTTEGDVPITLDAQHAPCTVNSFVSLANQKFFDDTPCHRLTTSGIYVLQCGDPTGTGRGGPGYSFADETTGHDTYPAGTLAMANAGPNTNGSQFFLCYGSCDALDQQPNYTVFGTISAAGMTVLKKVAKDGETTGTGDGAPKDHVKITSVSVG
ncbi:hypothetical protein GCM10028801_39500 [Nocardioides maradonensis]